MKITHEERRRLLEGDGHEIDHAVAFAVALALEDHRKARNPIAISRDGEIVLLQPDEIPLWIPPRPGSR